METSITTTADRALNLLSTGLGPEVVAKMLGVSVSEISQLSSNEDFAKKLSEARYKLAASFTERDSKYDRLEDAVIDKLEKSLPLLFKPNDLLRAAQVLNSIKRRGISSPEHFNQEAPVVVLNLPISILQTFTTDERNQVIKAGDQELVTIQSHSLLSKAKGKTYEQPRLTNSNPGGNSKGS